MNGKIDPLIRQRLKTDYIQGILTLFKYLSEKISGINLKHYVYITFNDLPSLFIFRYLA